MSERGSLAVAVRSLMWRPWMPPWPGGEGRGDKRRPRSGVVPRVRRVGGDSVEERPAGSGAEDGRRRGELLRYRGRAAAPRAARQGGMRCWGRAAAPLAVAGSPRARIWRSGAALPALRTDLAAGREVSGAAGASRGRHSELR